MIFMKRDNYRNRQPHPRFVEAGVEALEHRRCLRDEAFDSPSSGEQEIEEGIKDMFT